MIARKYIIAATIFFIIPIFTMMFSDSFANMLNKYIEFFADSTTFNAVVNVHEKNLKTFDMLKIGQFDFENVNFLADVNDKKLAKYFNKQQVVNVNVPVAVASKSVRTLEKRKVPSANHGYVISLIYVGSNVSYAIINGQIISIGDYLPSGEKLIAIEQKRIKISGRRGVKWFSLKL